MLQDPQLLRAVSQILQRSERQEEVEKLVQTFVDVGVLPQLDNRNNQILYGRRGTGKTHVLRVLGTRFKEIPRNAVLYIDARVLGSSTQFSDPNIPMPARCLALFRDILNELHNGLLEMVAELPSERADKAFNYLSALAAIGAEDAHSWAPSSRTLVYENENVRSEKAGVDLSVNGAAKATAGVDRRDSSKEGLTQSESATAVDRIYFPDVHSVLRDLLAAADAHLYVLLDEWSSLPEDVQPFLAEFVRRGLLPLASVTIKIGALEYRSRFGTNVSGRHIGFELGADISTATDLDDYYVFDRNPARISDTYADVLYRHVNSELPEDYLRDVLRVGGARALPSRLFTERPVFEELARASEGVIRDLINIFTKAYLDAHRRGRDSIDRKAVIEAARQWFEQDKARYLDNHLQAVLRRVVDDVIGTRRARSFLLPRELENHPVVQRLFDARVLHHMQRGYADKDNPGSRYNIYTLDYGTYVDLLTTKKEPEIEMIEAENGDERIVPFDDKRSIRRIILSEDDLRPADENPTTISHTRR